jgi:phage repressor protein C with HTH and peptisase S24 domain
VHKYSIGEVIENFRRRNSSSVTLMAMDDGLVFTGILPGDYLTVDLKIRPVNGDIVAMKLGGRLFVRKVYFDGRFLRMESDPERPAPFIIEQNAPGFELIGKVVNIFRELK